MMAGWKIVMLVGLFLNLVGVILLFLYVLPRRERTGGIGFRWTNTEKPNQVLISLERRWDIFSWIGLGCVVVGIVLQGSPFGFRLRNALSGGVALKVARLWQVIRFSTLFCSPLCC